MARRAAASARDDPTGPMGRSGGGGGGGSGAAGLSTSRLLEEDPAAALDEIARQLQSAAAADGSGAGSSIRRAGSGAGNPESKTAGSTSGPVRRGVAGAPVRTVAGGRAMGGRGQLLAGSLRQYNPSWAGGGSLT